MGKIVLLDELTINQIAAGEVIERPASVIKEMVENSIDAGATNITVEIKNGGISYIRISDNGKGIARDDVEMAFERHATSKIRSAVDLQEVKSMGFRGEALASIAAIANVELISKTEEEQIGTKIVVEGGNILNIEETGCSKGTIITVRNLFFNTPVRYKFLKRDFTETGYIEDVLTRIALVHPEIAIKLINSGKTVIQTNGSGEIKSVIYSLYGKDIAEEILNVSYEYEYIKVNGVIGKPAIARSNRSNQLFFVNSRYIKDKTLTAAAEQAFKGLLPIGKFGFIILNLEMPQSKVDVNVHPAKLEVRFAEEQVIFKAVYNAIKNTLLSSDLVSDREKSKEVKEASKNAFKIENKEVDMKPINNNKGGLFVKDEPVKEQKTMEGIDVLEKLKIVQEELKKQATMNPGIELTEEYKQMEQKYKDVSSIIEHSNIGHLSEKKESSNDEKEGEEQYKQEIEEKVVDFSSANSVKEEEQEQEEKIVDSSEELGKIKEINEEKEPESKIIDFNEKVEALNETQVSETENNEIGDTSKVESLDNEENEKIEEDKTEIKEDIQDVVNKKIGSFEEMYRQLFGKEPYEGRRPTETVKNAQNANQEDDDWSSNVSVFEDMEEYNKPTYKFVGIAFKTYIILEMNNELYIMDQHAAHERILYERVKANFYSDDTKDCQLLLLPDIITLTPKEMNIAKDNFDLFEQAGFMVEEFGENTIKLSGVPEMCVDLETKELFIETLDEINTVARTAKQEKEEKFIATVACKAAVKANMALTEEEVNSLMEELLKLPNPFSCPHGRPTVIKMSKYDIEKKFARK